MNIAISGATKGIGRAIAEHFANAGFNVAVCARTQSDLDEMKASFQKRFPNIKTLFLQIDMQKKTAVEEFAQQILHNWNSLDVLVNNAGIFQPGDVHTEADGQLEFMIETNLYSAYYLTRALIGSMIKNQSGHIFNICSVAGLKAYPGGGSYSISKFAMNGFSQNLRDEMKDKGIRVTAVHPGATWSNSWAGSDISPERIMPAEDIAKAVYNAWEMSPVTVVEDIILRPQLGDL
ncbi:MAG: SDR family oxidoreductase [Saprospiraceae bacterium]|nr:SDR family oxidoreductase [Saprospiraceae bacterium]